MPRRYVPRTGLVRADGRPGPVLERLLRSLRELPEWVRSTEQQTLAAAVAATAVAVADPGPEALYKLTYYLRVTQAATTSSSVQVIVRWTDGGIAQSFTAAALSANTTATHQVDEELTIRSDPDTSVTVETTYSSVGAQPMQYDFQAAIERIDQRGGLNLRGVS